MTPTEPSTAPVPEASGADLARIALQTARLAAKNRGTGPAKSTRPRRKPDRGTGREPVSFAAALTALMESRGWQAPAAGGSLTDRWPDIAPELAAHVRIGRFNTDTGVLDLLPDSPAYATQLRLHGAPLVTRINTALHGSQQQGSGVALVRSIRVLAPGSAPAAQNTTPSVVPAPSPAEPGPVHTREDASAGYHQALAAAQAGKAKETDPLAPAVQAAIERQDQVLRARRESKEAFADARELTEQLQNRARVSVDPRARALARARTEKAGHIMPSAYAQQAS